MATAQTLLTAAEYAQLPDMGYPTELVRGEIVRMSPPNSRHGQVCAQVSFLLKLHAVQNNLGHVLTNDSGVITERGPDSVRGADIAFYSFDRVPPGPLPQSYLKVPPDLIFEVKSPTDRRKDIAVKVAEYLDAGVGLVVVLDPEKRSAYVHHPSGVVTQLGESDTFNAPNLLGDFSCRIGQFLD